MKFDTRDKKPKLWNIAVLSGALLAVIALLLHLGAERYGAAISVSFIAYYVIVLVLLLSAFCKQIQYNSYSSNTIFYMGFTLFLLAGGFLFIFLFDFYVSGSQRKVMIHDLIANLFAAAYLYFKGMLLGIMAADAIVSRYEPEPYKDFIILSCGIRRNGTRSPLLRDRVDRALRFAKKQKALIGKEPIFVASGGQGPDEPISEAASMKRHLLEQGVPEERILVEDRSTDTFENMKLSKEVIWAAKPDGKVAFSTASCHVFRGGLYARRVKMRAVGMGAKTKWYFGPARRRASSWDF